MLTLPLVVRVKRAEALADFLTEWEVEHGALTAEEIAGAERELGLNAVDSAA